MQFNNFERKLAYTESEIESICTLSKADSDPPSSGPGESMTKFINSLKWSNYLSEYFNTNDTAFSVDERYSYVLDLWPYHIFSYLLIIGFFLWLLYSFCMCCKCCYCCSGPVTTVQTKKQLLCPKIVMLIFGLIGLVFSPYNIFYCNKLQANYYYLQCVVNRWPGNYFYGAEQWEGSDLLANRTDILADELIQITQRIETILDGQYLNDTAYIEAVPDNMLSSFDSYTSQWVGYPETYNSNHADYSSELPEYYRCSVCDGLNTYKDSFDAELSSFTRELTVNMSNAISDMHSLLINPINSTIDSTYVKIEGMTEVDSAFEAFEEVFVELINDITDIEKFVFGYNITFLLFSTIVIFMQFLVAVMLHQNKYKWRKLLHASWCLHSCTMSTCNLYLVFVITAGLLPASIFLAESCQITTDMVNDNNIKLLFVKYRQDNNEVVGYCYYSGGDLPGYLGIPSDYNFTDTLNDNIDGILAHNFNSSYQYSSLESLKTDISAINTTIFVSTADENIHWNGSDDINFFLNNQSNSRYTQNEYMTEYTYYYNPGNMESECGLDLSYDYWVDVRENCPEDYIYLLQIQTFRTYNNTCFSIDELFTEEEIRARYDTGTFSNCPEAYREKIVSLWKYGNFSYGLDSGFESTTSGMKQGADDLYSYVYSEVNNLATVNDGMNELKTELDEITVSLNKYYNYLNCSMIKDSFDNMKLGFCGEFIANFFYFAIICGTIGISHLVLSVTAVIMLFRHRTDFEIDRERVLRQIGKKNVKNKHTQLAEISSITERSEIKNSQAYFN